MENHNVYSISKHDEFSDPLTELLREGVLGFWAVLDKDVS